MSRQNRSHHGVNLVIEAAVGNTSGDESDPGRLGTIDLAGSEHQVGRPFPSNPGDQPRRDEWIGPTPEQFRNPERSGLACDRQVGTTGSRMPS